jgi:tetratricopeptide (TPR) repeat protein
MTILANKNFDQAELLQLALDASRNNNAGAAISYLKEAVSREDATATAHYLLGGEYAQIQMYERAIEQMEAAIALTPSLDIARFQLGLLWLTSGNGENAQTVLAPLQEIPEDNALHYFGKGLIHLIHDQFSDCVQCLNKGIELNTDNIPLSGDMNRILEEIAKMDLENTEKQEKEADAENSDSQHVLLSAYSGRIKH